LEGICPELHESRQFHPPHPGYISDLNRYFIRISMTLTDSILFLTVFLFGVIVAYLFFRLRVGVIEERARNDLERWKIECTQDIRKDSVNRSRSTLKGRISEQMAPLFPEFPFSPSDARFIGNPIDFVVFDGYTLAKDEKGDAISVVLVEVKKGKGKLSREEILIKKAVEEGRVSWRTIFLKDDAAVLPEPIDS
jgi:predicted Holliday junction resolvase-like endonuclease